MESVTLETKINKKEYRAISYWNAFLRTPTLLILSICCVAVGVLNLLINQQGIMFYLSIVLVLYPFILIVVLSFSILRMNKSHDIEKATHARYTISEDGLRTELLEREGESFTRWEDIYRAYENKNYIILFVNRSQLIAMKKADFPKEGEAAVRSLLGRKLEKRCKIRQK